jgi:hypothetical protein
MATVSKMTSHSQYTQIQNLSRTSDLLLPELLSGELRVRRRRWRTR